MDHGRKHYLGRKRQKRREQKNGGIQELVREMR